MKTKLFPLFALFFILFSCKDDDEISPNAKIEGKYRYSSEGNMSWIDKTFNFVDVMEFKSDGTVTGESYTTDLGSDKILGYRGYFSGTYSIVNGKVTITYQESYHMNIEDVNYLPKADLTLSSVDDYYSDFSIAEDYSALSFICPSNAFCTTLPIFNKIN
ncbi:hypothetical protein LV84_00655 [Algoriphagus ratkowskyi]|uniref:Lipocalin-like protein n=1 Tax=Algoriphagus ratkowskyi TaxID=57028 RepID=A0A2W7S0L6_9BACT|nr:hypothetical protein [Algoriphagus ratkowskyi]PZX60379.1 hypothetical protein LV84_00655 [Algoriphagus ratkowskyi]TXD78193.1 hypothetical protein ESW18_09125 [Algoriphagus ratkowskyi]